MTARECTCTVMRPRKERVTALNKQISSVYLCAFSILPKLFFLMQSGPLGAMPIAAHITVAGEK